METKLSTNWKYYAIIGGVAGVGYVLYRAAKAIKKAREKRLLNKDTKEAEQKGYKLSYTLTTYKNLADVLFASFEYSNSINIFDPLDETMMYNVFKKLKNELDFLELQKAFGKREQPVRFIGYFLPPVNLAEWVHIAADEDEVDEINNILAKTGKIKSRL